MIKSISPIIVDSSAGRTNESSEELRNYGIESMEFLIERRVEGRVSSLNERAFPFILYITLIFL